MYEVIMIDGSKHNVCDLTLYDVFGELNYIKTTTGTYLNRNQIVSVTYKSI